MLPPAWTDVWICRRARGHLQATGRDARGRKQHRYHDDWSQFTQRVKFDGLAEFGRRLEELRGCVDSDLRRREPTLLRVAALAVAVIDQTGVRVGNREYARDNESRGLTTLEKSNADFHTTHTVLSYLGKSNKQRVVRVEGRRLARHLAALRDTPGQALLRYTHDGQWSDLTSCHVNEYLQRTAGEQTTAKRFRTWLGSVVAFQAIREAWDNGASPIAAQRQAVRATAERLGNTIAVAREHYIHPAVLKVTLEDAAEFGRKLKDYSYEGASRTAVDTALLELLGG